MVGQTLYDIQILASQSHTHLWHIRHYNNTGRSFLPTWKRRFFVLANGKIQYFSDENTEPSHLKGEYVLDPETTVSVIDDGSAPENSILIENAASGKMKCTFESDFEMRQWVVAIQMAVPSIFSCTNREASETGRQTIAKPARDMITVEKSMAAASDMEGWIKKLGSGVKTWKRRYMVLSGNKLQYCKS